MSRGLSPQQEQEIRKLQSMSQQLQAMQQNIIQMENSFRETERALEAIKDLPDDVEIYRASGSLLFRTELPKTMEKISEEREFLEMRLNSGKKQAEELEKKATDLEKKLRAEMGM
jgi:prefoldin beta subunit